jgi:hypothetical protein
MSWNVTWKSNWDTRGTFYRVREDGFTGKSLIFTTMLNWKNGSQPNIVNLGIGFGPEQNQKDNAMDDFSVLMVVSEDDESADLAKYKICDVIDYRTRQIVGEIYINKETGKQEYVQFKNENEKNCNRS